MLGSSLRHHRVGTPLLIVALASTSAGLGPAAAAEAPPTELRYVCVDAQDNVIYAASPAACGNRETLRTLPDDGPVTWCADHLGRLKEAARCSRRERTITVPDDGPVFLCARNIQGGTTLPRGALRTVLDVSVCNQDETGLVTPAAPEGVADAYTIDEDTLLVVPDKGVLDNDLDLTGAPLTARLVDPPSRGTLDFDSAGGFRFDPRGVFDTLDAGDSATTTFSYIADDGALDSEITTVTLTVTGRNDRPVATDDVFTTDEDTPVRILPPGALRNDTDAEGHQLTSDQLTTPDGGRLTVGTDGAVHFDPLDDFQHLGAGPGDDGSVTVAYVARDGSTASDEATVRIDVTGINDAPIGAPDALGTDENTALDIDPATLLANDSDAEGQPLTATDVSLVGTGVGTLATLPDGTLRYDPNADSADPDSDPDLDHLTAGQTQVVNLRYTARDSLGLGSASVTVAITVRGLSAPTANDDLRSTDEDHAIAIDLFANDQVRGGSLTLDTTGTSGLAVVEHDGVVRYDPRGAFDHLAAGAAAADSFTYTLTNGEGSSTGTVTTQVQGLNDAPVAVADRHTVIPGQKLTVADPGVLANDTDVDEPAAELTAILASPPDRGRLTLDPRGGFVFDPAGEFAGGGETTFTYRVSDGVDESATTTVTLSVSSNDPPAFTGEPYDLVVVVTDPAGTAVGTVEATDPDGDTLAFTTLAADTTAFDLDPATGELTVGPGGPPAVGTYTLTVGVDDGHGGTDQATVTVDVVPELDAADDHFVAVGNTPLVGAVPPAGPVADEAVVHVEGLLANDGGRTAEVVARNDLLTDEGGRVDIRADGSFTYTPPPADPNTAGVWDGQAELTDGFRYEIVAQEGLDDAVGDVTIDLLDAVWYVDDTADDGGEGTAWAPLDSLSDLTAPNDRDLPGQTLFVFSQPDEATTTDVVESSVYPGGATLEDGQALTGNGAGLNIAHGDSQISVVAPGPVPRIDGAPTAPAVDLALDNDLRGFTVGGDGDGIVGDDVGALTAELVTVRTLGDPLRLTGTAAVDVSIDDLGSRGTDAEIAITGVDGDVHVGTASLLPVDGPGGLSLSLSTLRGAVDIDAAHLGAAEFRVADSTATADVDIDVLTGHGAGAGVVVHRNLGGVTIGTLTLSDLAGTGIEIVDDDGTTFIADGVVRGDTSAPGALLTVGGGSAGSIFVGADLTHTGTAGTACRVVSVSGVDEGHPVDGGGIVEVGGRVVGQGCGVLVSGTTQAVAGVVRFTGGMAVTTAGQAAFEARDVVGSLEIPTGTSASTLTSTGHTALVAERVDIGVRGARFNRVDASFGTGAPAATGIAVTDLTADIDTTTGTARGLVVNAGTITTPGIAGAEIVGSSWVTLRGMLVDRSDADGVTVHGSQQITLDGLTIQQPDGVGMVVDGSGGVLVDAATVAAAGSYGIRVSDLVGRTTLRTTSVEGSRDTNLHVSDGTASDGLVVRDELVVQGSVFSGGEEEDDSVVILAGDDDPATAGAADLRFEVSGTTPAGSIGGDNGLTARATGGATLDLALSKFAVAGTARDALSLHATGEGTTLGFGMSTMNSSGGGGIQLAGGAGIRAVAENGAVVHGSMDHVQVTTTEDSGIILDGVDDVQLDIVGVQAAEGHGIEVTGASDVTLDQIEVTRPGRDGLHVFDSSDIAVDDSRFDLRRPPPLPFDAPIGTELPDFSAIRMRHLGGTLNAVTDTTLRASSGAQLRVHQGDVPAADAGVETVGSLKVSGLTAVETATDPVNGRTKTSPIPVPDGDAVSVVAGAGGTLAVDLTGSASSVDETFSLRAERGGDLTVTGGHRIEHTTVDSPEEREAQSGRDHSVAMVADGAGSELRLGLAGLHVVQVEPAAGTPVPGNALLVASQDAASVAPASTTSPGIATSSVTGIGAANAVQLIAVGHVALDPDSDAPTLSMTTEGLDVELVVPSGSARTADAVSVIAQDGGEVTDLLMIGGTVAAFGGEAIDLETVSTDPPDPDPTPTNPFPTPTPPWPEGTIATAAIQGATVIGGAGDAIEATGQVTRVAVATTTISGGSSGVRAAEGTDCVDLDDNDATGVTGTGYVLVGVVLNEFREPGHEGETVEEWLARKGNTGPAGRVVTATNVVGGEC